jgi:LmbE family N-acetylglucosaminyl deacetylase
MNKKKKMLLIEPHSDDSFISCGGYLLKHQENFDLYFCLVCASDLNMYHAKVSRETRINEYREYINFFNGKFITPNDEDRALPLDMEGRLDKIPRSQLVKLIEKAIFQVEPDILMVMGQSFHHDHTAVYEAVVAATRPTLTFTPKEIYIMENPTYVQSLSSSSKVIPDTYIELTESEINKKLECLQKIFPSQIREETNCLSPKGIKDWARYRGIEARSDYAEAFQTFLRVI